MLKNILLIGSGGFLGSVSRYYLSKINVTYNWFSVPIGTLVVNVLGCLIIGFLMGLADHGDSLSLEWRLFLMVGFCGGFTTFSSFASENLFLLHSGLFFSIALYICLSLFLSFVAVYFGYGLSRFVTGG